jgi:RNA polymerase sigma-70 factor (ECF subfamily)
MSTFLHIELPPGQLGRALRGDPVAQRGLYEALARPVYTLLLRLVRRPAIAEELLHEVFLDVLGNLHAHGGGGTFAGWVRAIAVNKALAHLRSPWRAPLARGEEGLHALSGTAPPGEEWQADLERALNALPDVARCVVWLHDVEGYTHAEIARLYGQTTSFSKSQLARAHATLRGLLQTADGDSECTLASRN